MPQVLTGPNEARVSSYALLISGSTATSGVIASVANPFGREVIISGRLRITTQSSGACTLDIGVAADGTTSNDTLIDGLSAAAAGLFSSVNDTTNGTNGTPDIIWGAAQFLTVAVASGNASALVATLNVLVTQLPQG